MTPLLSVQGLSVTIGAATPVDGITFDLHHGRILGLTGASGSGKTMTAFAVMGLLPEGASVDGKMVFDGSHHHPMDETIMARRRAVDIGFIFQEPMTALNPLMTIGRQVAELFRHHQAVPRGVAAEEARAVLDRVGMAHIPSSRYPHQISGGQRQRVAIAMAIALGPKLLLADEPTTALDTTTQREILTLLARLVKEDDMAMVLITHDLALIAQYADDILVMHEGQMTTNSPVHEMLAPHDATLRRLIKASLMASPAISKRTGEDMLSIKDVTKSYHRKRIFASANRKPQVDNVSFVLKRGQMLGLVGRSGCGKSTLSKIVLALTKADDGSIHFLDTPIAPGKISRQLRPRLSAVFQDPHGSFNPRRLIRKLVAEPLWRERRSAKMAPKEQRIDDALAAVGIPKDYKHKMIGQCSGGERQRIAFARAMITQPDVIVLDEPVSALDAPHRGQVMREITRLSNTHKIAVLFISHDLSVVRAFCPNVMVMVEGQIVEAGACDDIFTAPRHPETHRLINAMPDLRHALEQLELKNDDRMRKIEPS